jgi:predicted DNA-binding transcriptional regulator AlpA
MKEQAMLLRFKDLQAAGIVTNRHDVARKIASQEFPQPLELGPNKVAWKESEIDEWLERLPRRTPKLGPAPSKLV